MLAQRTYHRLPNDDVFPGQQLVCAQAMLDLRLERDREWILFDRRAIGAGASFDRREHAPVAAASGARKRGRTPSSLLRALRREPPVAGKPPRPADEDADTDALALGVVQLVDATVLRSHELPAANNRTRIRIGGPRSDRRVDRSCAQVAHVPDSNQRPLH